MLGYAWPGNVRELENTIERAAILAETDVIHAHDLPDKLSDKSVTPPALERRLGNDAGGPRARAYPARAEPRSGRQGPRREALGIHLSTLYRKVQRYRLENVGVGEAAAQSARSARRAGWHGNKAASFEACAALKPLVAIGIGTR